MIHSLRRSRIRFVIALVLAASPNGTSAGARAGDPPRASAATPTAAPAVTLITGDRVHLRTRPEGGQAATVEAAPGREGVAFLHLSRSTENGVEETFVVPADAAPLLAAGLLDPELFNVTELVRQGFGEPVGAGLPLILTFQPGRASEASRLASTAAVRVVRTLPSVGGMAVAGDRRDAGAFWKWLTGGSGGGRRPSAAAAEALRRASAAGLAKVWLNGRARLLLDESGPQVGLPVARQAGLTGSGVTVAVLDSGIKADHPDLAGRVTDGVDFTDTQPDAGDDAGHGTHVAGILAGSGAASSGRYEGVAREATLLNGKVCDRDGECPFDAIIAGMEWAAPRARIVNMSLGGGPSNGTDLLSQAVNGLSAEHGTLFVASAGNFGLARSVAAPAAADAAVAVGSVTKQDTLSVFSSRGPRVGDLAVKPDLAAPGSGIVAARAPGTPLGDARPVDNHYARLSGTSMSAPHVAGAAALLVEAHPDWSAARLKAALMSTTTPIAGAGLFDQGAGRLDLARAASQRVFADAGSLSFGVIRWPHDQPPISRTFAYHNEGELPLTLDLAVSVTGEDGGPAPAGLFAVSPSQITVPARGTALASVTLNPAAIGVGLFGGAVTATSGTAIVRTAVGTFGEPESYDLTLRAIGRTETRLSTIAQVTHLETGRVVPVFDFDEDGRAAVRLPRGTYDVIAVDTSAAGASRAFTLVSEPEVALHDDTEVILDARPGRPLSAVVDGRPSTVERWEGVGLASRVDGRGGLIGISLPAGNDETFAVPTSRVVTGHTYVFHYHSILGVPGAGSDTARYNLFFFENGRIPDRLAYRTRDRELATVRADYYAQGVAAVGRRAEVGFAPGVGTGFGLFLDLPVPSRRAEHYTARPVRWDHAMMMFAAGLEATFSQADYRPRGQDSVAWNRPPIGPAFNEHSVGGVFRGQNQIGNNVDEPLVGLFTGSQDGHLTDSIRARGVAGTTSLSRDGVALGSNNLPCHGLFAVPSDPGTYTLSCTGVRRVPWSTLDAQLDASWTFHDAGPAARQALPLLAVRASGDVDLGGAAPAGRVFPLGLYAQRQPGAPAARITTLELEFSYDDGATWQRAPVLRFPLGDRGLAWLRHPARSGFVSLRARAADSDGNRVTQTVIRAYSIVPRQ